MRSLRASVQFGENAAVYFILFLDYFLTRLIKYVNATSLQTRLKGRAETRASGSGDKGEEPGGEETGKPFHSEVQYSLGGSPALSEDCSQGSDPDAWGTE